MGDTAKITGQTFGGEERIYTFNLMNADDGGRVFHEFLSLILMSAPKLKEVIIPAVQALIGLAGVDDEEAGDALRKELMGIVGSGALFDVMPVIPTILPWTRIKSLSRDMLADATIQGEPADKNGSCSIFAKDPFEIYYALFWALVANFPKYMDPLLDALTLDDSSQEDSEEGKETSEKDAPEK